MPDFDDDEDDNQERDRGDDDDDDDDDDENDPAQSDERDERDAAALALLLFRSRQRLIRTILAQQGERSRLTRLDEQLVPSRYARAIGRELIASVRRLTESRLEAVGQKFDDESPRIETAAIELAEQLAEADFVAIQAAIMSGDDERISRLVRLVITGDPSALRENGAKPFLTTLTRTALHSAANGVLFDAYRFGAVDRVRWICEPNACPICEPANGVVRNLGDEFPSVGVAYPPTHPNCRCTIEPA